MEFSEIKELIELVASRKISTFELEKAGFRIKIKGSESAEAVVTSANLPLPAAPVRVELPAAPPQDPVPVSAVVELYKVKAPIVGTFYKAPSPTSEPFVKVGDRVELGRILCIIEAMKLMNEIESEVAGEIVEIYVENGQPVEYGQPLFGIRTS